MAAAAATAAKRRSPQQAERSPANASPVASPATALRIAMEQIANPFKPIGGERGAMFHFLIYFAWIIIFYNAITFMVPVESLATSVSGIRQFTNTVSYTRLNGESATIEDVSTLDDAVLWGEGMLKALLTGESYRAVTEEDQGKHTRTPDEHLMLLRVHRLLNTIVVSQRRVYPSDCSYDKMKPIYEDCYEELDGHEIKSGKMVLIDNDEGGIKRVVPYDASQGGFAVQLPLDKRTSVSEYNALREEGFWDRATREFRLGFAFHNSPGHYTGNAQILFTLSPYGEVVPEVTIRFLRMKPYSEETNGIMLAILQIATLTGVVYLSS